MNVREAYNKIAKDWYQDHRSDTWWIEGTDHLISLLPPHGAVLDVGCGTGVKTKYFVDRGFQVAGIDFAENMIALAKQDVPQATFEVLDAYEIEKLSGEFDAVFVQAMLLHIPKSHVIDLLQKFKKKIKPGGLLYIAVKEIKENQPEEMIVKDNDYGYEYERFFSYYTLPELRKYIELLGMELVWEHSELSGKTVWLQIIAKNV